ncbi:MAG: hypothetical protein IPO18_19570 [bacterium]|nr:hypothetical protein [bacterium]
MMMKKSEPLDRLLREAAGERTDPAPSRRAIRAVLGLKLAQQERREARARVLRTAFVAAALLVVMGGQLGSDDFAITVEKRMKAGKEWKIFRQGLRGEEVWTSNYWTDAGMDDADAEELLQQRAAEAGIIVGLTGWQVGQNNHFILVREYIVDGQFVAESSTAPGYGDAIPAWLKAFVGTDHRGFIRQIDGIWKSRTADFTVPMYFGDMSWVVQGWRIHLPDRGEIIYYRGVRADGVRSKDPDDS